ncbi:MAG: class I SAM-dependent methyltransferase [Thermoanaerobaculia bacterium]|nr:class I SAM-dependent methyltransferase [Thermoanaerobaculia bacterium]
MRRIFFNLKHIFDFLRGRPVFELPYYREAELSRLMNLFAHVDLDAWRGMRILEVGAGLGHLGDVFAQLGFDVTSSDGRPEHVERMKARGRDAIVLDLDEQGVEGLEGYDVILAFGVLYHLGNPERFLESCGQHAKVLLLESAVSDAAEPKLDMVKEIAAGWRGQDQALNEIGCRPSVSWVEATCRRAGFDRIRDISNPIADWEIGTFDWSPTGHGETRSGAKNYRRMWVMERTTPE